MTATVCNLNWSRTVEDAGPYIFTDAGPYNLPLPHTKTQKIPSHKYMRGGWDLFI